MAEGTAVALLFDDAALGAHLRDALHERGARIVHEGGLADLSRALVQRVGADVLVINLDENVDDVLGRLDESIEGSHPRVVFNEAESSRRLDGWDRARWARHLAAKVLAQADVDPPRPPEAPEAPAAAPAFDDGMSAMPDDHDTGDVAPADAGPAASAHEAEIAAESESLEAELEALLAGEPLPDGGEQIVAESAPRPDLAAALQSGGYDEDTSGLDDFELDELALRELEADAPAQPLYDGDFLEPDAESRTDAKEFASDEATTGGLSGLDIAWSEEDEATLQQLEEPAEPRPGDAAASDAETLFRSTDSWSLMDDHQLLTVPPASASDYGIEKLSASEFLAPESDLADDGDEPFMTLELVSLEEAIAPTRDPFHASSEMLLDELGGALSRVVIIGATTSSGESVSRFMKALPEHFRATIVHVQHLAGRPTEELAGELAGQCTMPVRIAAHGQTARAGEILVLPAEHQLRLTRDGRVELKPTQDIPSASPSIDACFTAVANVFGVDALAILFAGQANDAVAGCQAVHDRGGRIWVEDAPGEHFADMVSGVLAEYLADFSGTPTELAARLIEEY